MSSKVIKVSKLASLVKTLKKKKKKIVFTNGCFDLIHPGHIKLLSSAKKYGEVLILGLNSDSSIRKIKGEKRPIFKEKERIEILSAITYIDYIVVFKEETPFKLIKIIKPDVLVKGGDWKEKDIVGADFVKKQGGKVIRIKLKKGYSTTTLIEKIKKNYEK
ncbi:MAG: D-glycero-beta-D-manno-heptose 1-phosphate adenylyltransferase [Candidatus Omnitrophota bacterium]|nr:MAG: D-glycero-beta-D-manno-heptose 1-phosphate adenylyltransferase [Candidatus Omnitrophota bacterium]